MGAGFIVSYKDIFPGKTKSRFSIARLEKYNNANQLLASRDIELHKRHIVITDTASSDGYLNITLLVAKKQFYNATVSVAAQTPAFRGSIADHLQLTTFDECLPPVYVDPCDPGSGAYDPCICSPGSCVDPCDNNPYGCECDPANCEPLDPCYNDPWGCECDISYCPCYDCECDPMFCIPGGDSDTDPCSDAMKAAAANTTDFYNENIASLIIPELALVSFNPIEVAFSIQDGDPATVANVVNGTPTSAQQVYDDHTIATAHTHPPASFPAPSATDLYLLGEIYADTDGGSSYVFIWAANGSQYALQVNDPAALDAYLMNYPRATNLDASTNSFITGTPMQNDFTAASTYFVSLGLDANQAYEKAMAFVLDKYNTGATLQKADASGNFSTVVTKAGHDALGNPIYLSEDCN